MEGEWEVSDDLVMVMQTAHCIEINLEINLPCDLQRVTTVFVLQINFAIADLEQRADRVRGIAGARAHLDNYVDRWNIYGKAFRPPHPTEG